MKTAHVLTGRDLAVLMGSTVRRYRRGEITERTANRETIMIKTLVDCMAKGSPEEGLLSGAQARERHRDVFDRILKLIMEPGMEDVRESYRAALKGKKL